MKMPVHFDDAVVGAGILGLAHAYHLAKRGRRVLVLERHPRAMGASVRNFGMLWPIGQPAGPLRDLALRSLSIWHEVLEASKLWHARCGSLHLAYREDEMQVLREFVGQAPTGDAFQLLDAKEVRARSPLVRFDGLLGGMFSPEETCVDPRQITAELPQWLSKKFRVNFQFNQLVLGFATPFGRTHDKIWQTDRLWVCSGDELQTLYPEVLLNHRMRRCKLQMMRSQPFGSAVQIGPMLAAGLTLRHYTAFASCPSLPQLKQRVARESPEFDRYGIHVMASQNGVGEIVIGDSHEYELENNEPFNREEIDRLILDYLKSFLNVPGLNIAGRWHGHYMKHPSASYFIERPADDVTIINGVGGNGMTLSFGLAEQAVNQVLGAK